MSYSLIVPPISSFPLEMRSDHFVIHYGLRNPVNGKGRGGDGVRDHILILTYLEALERLYDIMINPPWSRPHPVVDVDNRTHVFVLNEEAQTAEDSFANLAPNSATQNVPFIVLPCRSAETTTQAELQRATAEAVHEATHVFNYTERRYDSIMAEHWRWFDEGFAIFMETLVVSGNPDYIRYLLNWIDLPEMPLDHTNAKYQAGMFVRYLAKRLGNIFVNNVWVQSQPRERPLETIQRLLPHGQVLVSSDPNTQDLFASGYCMDPYFLWDYQSAGLAPDVFARYGERAITESFVLWPNRTPVQAADTLSHLACRYYRFYLKGAVSTVDIELTPEKRQETMPLKAEVAVITVTRQRTNRQALRPSQAPGRGHKLSVTMGSMSLADIDHIVMVVTNCGTRPNMDDDRDDHDDEVNFSIEASAQ